MGVPRAVGEGSGGGSGESRSIGPSLPRRREPLDGNGRTGGGVPGTLATENAASACKSELACLGAIAIRRRLAVSVHGVAQ